MCTHEHQNASYSSPARNQMCNSASVKVGRRFGVVNQGIYKKKNLVVPTARGATIKATDM